HALDLGAHPLDLALHLHEALIDDGIGLRELLADPVLGGATGHQQNRRRHQHADLHHLSHIPVSFVDVGQRMGTNAEPLGRATTAPAGSASGAGTYRRAFSDAASTWRTGRGRGGGGGPRPASPRFLKITWSV